MAKVKRLEDATMEEEIKKEASRDYILPIIRRAYPTATRIEDIREEHLSGIDWKVYFPTGNYLEIDDKNDRHLGITGNINLDEKTTEKKETIQLFVNYPTYPGYFLFFYNDRITMDYIMENAIKKLSRMQTWGELTYSYVIPVHKILQAIPDQPQFSHPQKDWFKWKRAHPRNPDAS